MANEPTLRAAIADDLRDAADECRDTRDDTPSPDNIEAQREHRGYEMFQDLLIIAACQIEEGADPEEVINAIPTDVRGSGYFDEDEDGHCECQKSHLDNLAQAYKVLKRGDKHEWQIERLEEIKKEWNSRLLAIAAAGHSGYSHWEGGNNYHKECTEKHCGCGLDQWQHWFVDEWDQ